MHELRCVLAVLPIVGAMWPVGAAAADYTPAGDYCARLLQSVRAIQDDLPRLRDIADTTAGLLVAGGRVWIAGSHQGFVLEGSFRAGGMMTLKVLQDPTQLQAGDLILLGTLAAATAQDQAVLQAAAEAQAMVVLFAPTSPPGGHLYVSPHAPEPGTDGRLPVASPALAAALWTFTGELVAALTRLGKMPPMYQSVLVPGGRERNEQHLPLTWEPDPVAPVEPGKLGSAYLEALSGCLRQVMDTQLAGFQEAGQWAARAIVAGHTAWYVGAGHMPPSEPGQPGDPGVLQPLSAQATPDNLGDQVKAGDLVLYVGYYEPLGDWISASHALGARIVTVLSGTPERRAQDMGADLNLCGCWPYGDSVVEVPGYDVKILPASGVVQSAAYWMLTAETVQALR